MHRLVRTQLVASPIPLVWPFFIDPANLWG